LLGARLRVLTSARSLGDSKPTGVALSNEMAASLLEGANATARSSRSEEPESPSTCYGALRRGSMVICEVSKLTKPIGMTTTSRYPETSSMLSKLVSQVMDGYLPKEIASASHTLQLHIDSELRRQRDEKLVGKVVKCGMLALARYERNCSQCALVIGMKRYKRSKEEYERSNRIVRRLRDIKQNIVAARGYETQIALVEAYHGDVQQIFCSSRSMSMEQEDDFLTELVSGRLQAYVASLLTVLAC
jgi:hypothetical protein